MPQDPVPTITELNLYVDDGAVEIRFPLRSVTEVADLD